MTKMEAVQTDGLKGDFGALIDLGVPKSPLNSMEALHEWTARLAVFPARALQPDAGTALG